VAVVQQLWNVKDRIHKTLLDKTTLLEQCCVCLSPYGGEQDLKIEVFRCGHWSCQACAPEFHSCPSCRAPIFQPVASGIDFKFLTRDIAELVAELRKVETDLLNLCNNASGACAETKLCEDFQQGRPCRLKSCPFLHPPQQQPPQPPPLLPSWSQRPPVVLNNGNGNGNGAQDILNQRPFQFQPFQFQPQPFQFQPFQQPQPQPHPLVLSRNAETVAILKAIRYYETVKAPGCVVVHATVKWSTLVPGSRQTRRPEIAAALEENGWVLSVDKGRVSKITGNPYGPLMATLVKIRNHVVAGGGGPRELDNVDLDSIWFASAPSAPAR